MSTMEPSMIELINAINEFKKQYERAKKLDFVKKTDSICVVSDMEDI